MSHAELGVRRHCPLSPGGPQTVARFRDWLQVMVSPTSLDVASLFNGTSSRSQVVLRTLEFLDAQVVLRTPPSTVCPSTAKVSSVLIVGLRKRQNPKRVLKLRRPRPISCRPLACILDPPPGDFDIQEAEPSFLATCAPGERKRLLDAFSQMEDAGLDRHSNHRF